MLHLTATTSNVITGTEDLEHDDSIYMPEEFLDGIKGPRSTVHGQYISGYADNFEELVTVLDKHAHVCVCVCVYILVVLFELFTLFSSDHWL